MMRKITTLIGLPLLALLLVVSSCREEQYDIPAPAPVGGKGGNISLKVVVQHHDTTVNDARVFIEYDAISPQPDTGDYDLAMDGSSVKIDSLLPGNYYIFALGTQPSLSSVPYNLYGGATFNIIDTIKTEYTLYLNVDNEAHHPNF